MAVYEDVLPGGERPFNPCASVVEMGLEVS